jgi:peptidoglycan/LPS O-acetylase OafA/YrhL
MKLTYRPEIDGLRAIAIIFIILSHFKQLNFVSGGVNIFFVISGYLITHIFLNQQLEISKFYKQRFLKLYPRIFIISLITLILFFLIGDFVQWTVILRSFISTIIGLFNFYLIKIGNVYGQENYINPFLPFWAFCVIFQFYIIYPIILKIIFFIKKKFNLNNNFIIISLFTISVVLLLFYYYFRDNNLFNFYSPLSRYWQFILGSCLYFLIQFKKKLYFNNITIYFTLILIIVWQLNLEWFSSWRKVQVLLTISTILFLYSIIEDSFFNKVFSIRPLTYLGKISYELYLVHMPIIYFITLWFDNYNLLIIALLLCTFIFVYKKANIFSKYKLFIFDRKFLFIVSISLFIIILFSKTSFNKFEEKLYNFFIKYNYIYTHQYSLKEKFNYNGLDGLGLLLGNNGASCHNIEFNNDLALNCGFTKDFNNKNFYLVGGSQLAPLSYDLKKRLSSYNYYHFTSGGFIYLPGQKKKYDKEIKSKFFERNNFIKKKILSSSQNSIVLIYGRYPVYLEKSYFDNQEKDGKENGDWRWFELEDNNDNFTMLFKENIEILLKNKNLKIILLYPIPEVGFDPKSRIINHKFFKNKITTTSYDVFKKRTKSSFELLNSIKSENIYRVYPHTLFCDTTIKNRCVTHDDMNIFYSDDDHPSIKGAEMINDLIIKEIEKIELKSN